MTTAHFTAFIDHAYWGLDKLFDALEPLTDDELDREVMAGAMPARHILLHMYRFEAGWLARLNGDDPPPPEDFADLASLRTAWEPVQQGWRDYVAGLSEEELGASFTVSFGNDSFSPARHQAISQFVQHQGQHRSELAIITSTFGRSPGEFDWWDYLQDRGLTPT
jgi:uncharacterized damage-inducible protein DinB